MIELLDYILDYDDNFWIISSINDKIYGSLVYQVDEDGNRFNNITKKYYKKVILKENEKEIPKFKKIFKPRFYYKESKNNLFGVWKEYVSLLNEIGIDDEHIGIFGSTLIGFSLIKDVDFIIYGKDNLLKYKNKHEYIKKCLNATSITDEHALLQYEKNKHRYNSNCDLLKIIKRNWSGFEINGVLSTPRFIIEGDNKIPKYTNKFEEVEVLVIDDTLTDALPRKVKVILNGEIFTIITNMWKYQSFGRNNDILKVKGSIDYINKTICLENSECYIKYITY